MSDSANPAHIEWNDLAELHEKDDGGGILSGLKGIRQATLAELVRYIAQLPEAEREQYVIYKAGDHRLEIGEIMLLSRRPDLPRP